MIIVAIILLFVAILGAGEIAAAGVRAQIDARLRAAGAGANSGLVSIEAEQLSLLREITLTADVGTAMAAHSSVELDGLVTPLQVNSGVPMVDVVLPDGQVILAVRSQGAPRPVASRKGLPAVARSLKSARGTRGGRFSEIATLQGAPTLLTIGPVFDGTHEEGVVLVMTPLADVLARLSAEVGATLTSYASDGLPIATTSSLTPPAVVPITASMIFASKSVTIRENPGSYREMLGRLIVDHRAITILGVSVHDDSFTTELLVDLCCVLGLLLAALLIWGSIWLKKRSAGAAADETL